jgi:hypothetical protein
MTALDTFASLAVSDRTYCDNANVFFIDTPDKDENSLYALSAVINSTVYSVLARSIANPQTNGYFKFNKQFLAPVPFPLGTFQQNTQLKSRLAKVAKRMTNCRTGTKLLHQHSKEVLQDCFQHNGTHWMNCLISCMT